MERLIQLFKQFVSHILAFECIENGLNGVDWSPWNTPPSQKQANQQILVSVLYRRFIRFQEEDITTPLKRHNQYGYRIRKDHELAT